MTHETTAIDGARAVTGRTSEPRSFHDTIRDRRSVRGFVNTPVAPQVIRQVLDDAQCSPSNCNTQPWHTHIVSGSKRDELSRALLEAFRANRFSPDFTFDEKEYVGVHVERYRQLGKSYYGAMSVARDDVEARRVITEHNLYFFGAPQVALLFMPPYGDSVRVASDIGMYAQTFLLSLVAHGLGGIPQTMLGFFADTVREVLGLSSELKMLFGISFGYPDACAPGNSFRMSRAPSTDCVTFHGV